MGVQYLSVCLGLSFCLSVRLTACLSVCLSICLSLSVSLSACLSVSVCLCLSVGLEVFSTLCCKAMKLRPVVRIQLFFLLVLFQGMGRGGEGLWLLGT